MMTTRRPSSPPPPTPRWTCASGTSRSPRAPQAATTSGSPGGPPSPSPSGSTPTPDHPDLTITSERSHTFDAEQLVRALRRHHPGRTGRRQHRRVLVHQAGGGDRGPLLQGPLARVRLGQRDGRRPRRRAHRHRVGDPQRGRQRHHRLRGVRTLAAQQGARSSSGWSSPIPSPAAT